MAINKCPNLEELSIEGSYSVPTDIRYISEGRWPNLRKLTLGDVCIDWIPRSLSPGEKRPFITFLEAHPQLESLNLSRHTVQPLHLATLDPRSLNRVTSFSGTHQQLQALSQIHPELKVVAFRDSVETREVSAPTVANLLRELTSLTELRISFTLHSMYDSGNLLRSLVQSCPRLRHLHLTCAHKPSFQLVSTTLFHPTFRLLFISVGFTYHPLFLFSYLYAAFCGASMLMPKTPQDAFAKTIRGFPKLRSLDLTVVRYPGDETLASGAACIAKSNPRLHRFSLTFIPPVYPVSLPFSFGFLRPILMAPDRATGSFELRCDEHGLPMNIAALEQSKVVWPWGMGVTFRTRKYVRDLRPPSIACGRKTGWRGFLGLVLEKSSAGEEVRMMLFCAMLVCFALWGFVVTGRSRAVEMELAMKGVESTRRGSALWRRA